MIPPESLDPALAALGVSDGWRSPRPVDLAGALTGLRPIPGATPRARLDAITPTLARWQDPASAERRACAELLPAITGFAAPMIEVGMGLQAGRWSPEALAAALDLDHPRPAHGPGPTAVVSAGNVPGIGALDLVWSVLSGAPVAVKMSSAEPVTALLLAHSLSTGHAEPPAIARHWRGGDPARDPVLLDWADRILAYGRDETLDALATALADARGETDPRVRGSRLHGFGHRVSAAIVPRGGMAIPEAARRLAVDVVLWDQEGCLSPHVALVEGSDRAASLAEAVASELDRLAGALPRGPMDVPRKAAIRRALSQAETRGMGAPGPTPTTFRARDAHVILSGDGALRPSPLGRTLRVIAVPDLATALTRLEPWRGRVQSIGVAAPPSAIDAFREPARSLEATRVCLVGRMQEPGPGWTGQEPWPSGEVRLELDPGDDGVWSSM